MNDQVFYATLAILTFIFFLGLVIVIKETFKLPRSKKPH